MSAVSVEVFQGAYNELCVPLESSSTGSRADTFFVPLEVQSTHCIVGRAAKSYRMSSVQGSTLDALGVLASLLAVKTIFDQCVHLQNLQGEIQALRLKAKYLGLPNSVSISANRVLDSKSSTIDNVVLRAEINVTSIKKFLNTVSRRRALDYMYEILEQAYSESDVVLVNEMLYSASKWLVGESVAVSFLRATYRVKERSTYWQYYYDSVKRSLEGNPELDRMLRGLKV